MLPNWYTVAPVHRPNLSVSIWLLKRNFCTSQLNRILNICILFIFLTNVSGIIYFISIINICRLISIKIKFVTFRTLCVYRTASFECKTARRYCQYLLIVIICINIYIHSLILTTSTCYFCVYVQNGFIEIAFMTYLLCSSILGMYPEENITVNAAQ